VNDYNSILNALAHQDINLLKERVRFLDRKIAPGINKLTWASKGVTGTINWIT
jgi:dynein heavy chain